MSETFTDDHVPRLRGDLRVRRAAGEGVVGVIEDPTFRHRIKLDGNG